MNIGLLVFYAAIMLAFFVWGAIVWIRRVPETDADRRGWYESGIGAQGGGGGSGLTR